VATWWTDAKFGIYVHWTLASVPAWGLHTSFYWPNLLESREKERGGFRARGDTFDEQYAGLWEFHQRVFGANFEFPDFAPMFRAELFDPERWAEVFARSGAKYVVLTAKHHDGFSLWPDPYATRDFGRPWNAMDIGPKKDLVGMLVPAVRNRGLKMGLYYSLYEWFNPLWLHDRPRFVSEHMHPQLKDMVFRYKPDILWTDGEWLEPDSVWKSTEFLAWLFNESPVPDIVVNDRWGKNCVHKHGGFYTTEFTPGMSDGRHAWEENRTVVKPMKYDAEGRPLWYDWVFNRRVTASDYYTPWELILTLADVVSRGGNLLLNIGPTPDGRILEIQEERLNEIGEWLRVNGEAIYGTRPWRRNCQWSSGSRPKIVYDQDWRTKYDIEEIAGKPKPGQATVEAFFTAKADAVYAIVPRWPARHFALKDIGLQKDGSVTMLGMDGRLACRNVDGGLEIDIPPLTVDELPCRHAYVLKLARVLETGR
jgi:alpha-L-fucosidase